MDNIVRRGGTSSIHRGNGNSMHHIDVKSKLMYATGTLSHVYVAGDADGVAPDNMEMHVHSLLENLPTTVDKQDEFRQAIAEKLVMQKLK